MATLVKILSTELDSLSRRIGKFLRFGKSDVQTSLESAPYGVDSNPIKGMVAVYAETNEKGKTVIVGYLNKNQLAGVGEFRAYSTNSDGDLQTYAWLKNDGTMELGGSAKHLARFEDLKTGFDRLKSDVNDLKSKWNTFAGAYIPGGPAVQGTPATVQTSSASTASIDDAKIDEIKTL